MSCLRDRKWQARVPGECSAHTEVGGHDIGGIGAKSGIPRLGNAMGRIVQDEFLVSVALTIETPLFAGFFLGFE